MSWESYIQVIKQPKMTTATGTDTFAHTRKTRITSIQG